MTTRKLLTNPAAMLALVAVGILAACSETPRSPDVAYDIRHGLDQAGLPKISVDQDREKGVVVLVGRAASAKDKAQAETIAKSMAGGQVVSNLITVFPGDAESEAGAVNSDLDKGIEQKLDAALILTRFHDHVRYTVKNHVVTLTGQVDTQSKRRAAEKVAASIPKVYQVVNELQVKNQKAASSE